MQELRGAPDDFGGTVAGHAFEGRIAIDETPQACGVRLGDDKAIEAGLDGALQQLTLCLQGDLVAQVAHHGAAADIAPVLVTHRGGTHGHGQVMPVLVAKFQLVLLDLPLLGDKFWKALQKGRTQMRRKQLDDGSADELLTPVAQHPQLGVVDALDASCGIQRVIAAGGVLVEVFGLMPGGLQAMFGQAPPIQPPADE